MPNENISDISTALASVTASLQEYGELARRSNKVSDDARVSIDALLKQQSEIKAELSTTQRALAELEGNGAGGDVQHISLGSLVAQAEGLSTLRNSTVDSRLRVEGPRAALTTSRGAEDGASGALVAPTFRPGVIALPTQKLTVEDLLQKGRMDTDTLTYAREVSYTNNAAFVKETEKKPESSLRFENKTVLSQVIAHTLKASRQILTDASQLSSFIDGRATYGVRLKKEAAILNGKGPDQGQFDGLIPSAAKFDAQGLAPKTRIDAIRAALLQASLSSYPPSAVVVHPVDWAVIELEKDTTGRYIIGNPQGTLTPTLWGIPVVLSQSIERGKFLLGAFDTAAQLYTRWDLSVQMATTHEDDFARNMVTFLCEERAALAIYRPDAFIYGDTVVAAASSGKSN